MLRRLAGYGAAAGLGGLGGLAIGATYHDHQAVRTVVSKLTSTANDSVDARSASALVGASVRLAERAGGLCVLSTVDSTGAVCSRMVQPLVARGTDGEPSLRFHTTQRSAKFAQLSRDGRCTLSFLDPAALTCIVFQGEAERLPPAEEQQLWSGWKLFPPLQMLYPAEAARSFSGWRVRPTQIQLVSIPANLGGGTREDWRAPEVRRRDDGSWAVTCSGGMQ